MKRALAVILAAGFVVGSYATDARVVVMGRHSAFYRDEVSVFRNPADISLYPDMLYGSFGWMNDLPRGNYQLENIYPQDPFFGGMVSYRFSEEENGPMLSIGAFVNRYDNALYKLLAQAPATLGSIGALSDGTPIYADYNLVDPVAKLDLIVGYDLGNGIALGIGAYGAYQRYSTGPSSNRTRIDETSILKGTLGVNWNLEQGLDLEASFNGGRLTGVYDRVNVISEAEYFYRGDVRFFSQVPAINGSFVPQVGLEFMQLANKEIIDLEGGVGVNINIDRGFFWSGIQGLYTQSDEKVGSKETYIGARFSFGIERNVITDWFLIRVGGHKVVRNHDKQEVRRGGATGFSNEWVENPSSDGTDRDLVALGFGINVDNRLRIDFVASEDLPYTFTNLVSGNKSHIFNRVSATYRF